VFRNFFITILFLALSTVGLTGCTQLTGSGTGEGNEEGYDYTTGQDFADSVSSGNENPELAARFDGANVPNPEKDAANSKFKDVHFGYDSSKVSQEDLDTIKAVSEYMVSNPTVVVELEGHCDRRGTSEYNLALGNYRARSVAAALVRSGVAAKRITTVSYGAELPLDLGTNEVAYAKNRRVHFVLYAKDAGK
jgi:peptidoglycan-associated lipoprotein